MRVIDCFMFGQEYELELLDLRLQYLNSVVDFFVLVESSFTHTGNQKELFFQNNKKRFENYSSKIIHIIIEKTVGKPWDNENYQRNQILEGLNQLNINNEDVIMISDLDEIPNKKFINYYIDNKLTSIANSSQDSYFYYLNWQSNQKWNGTQLTRGKHYLEGAVPQDIRNNRKNKKFILDVHGGWHFSYTGGSQAILTKFNSTADGKTHRGHNDLESIEKLLQQQVYKQLNKGIDLVLSLKKIDINSTEFPDTFLENFHLLVEKELIRE